jgi:transcription initiation factor TFIIIB Brf1 subunit/transcription initiation factor TFIIB
MVNISEVKSCLECGSRRIRRNITKQQIICRDCGLIYEPLSPKAERKYERVSKR